MRFKFGSATSSRTIPPSASDVALRATVAARQSAPSGVARAALMLAAVLSIAFAVLVFVKLPHKTSDRLQGQKESVTSSDAVGYSRAGAAGDKEPGSPPEPSQPGIMDLRTMKDTPSASGARVPADPLAEAKKQVDALHREAILITSRLCDDHTRSVDALGLKGMIYNQLGDTAKAEECWQECIRRNPNRADAFESLGQLSIARSEFEQAVAICRRGLSTAGETQKLNTQLGEALIQLGKPEEAIEPLTAALNDASTPSVDALTQLGKAQLMLEHYEPAKQFYARALKIDPTWSDALFGYANACSRLGQDDEADQYFAKHKQVTSGHVEASNRRRSIEGDINRSRKVVATACYFAIRVYVGFREFDKAEPLLRRGVAVNPDEVDCRAQLAILLRMTGRAQDAIPLCEKLVALQPDNFEHHLHLSHIYSELGRNESATEEADRALALAPDNQQVKQWIEDLKR